MTKRLLAVAFLAMLTSSAVAQHSDVEFGYDDASNPMSIVIENDELTSEGIQFFEAEFEPDVFNTNGGRFSADEPGFATEPAEGLIFNPNDVVGVRVLDAANSGHSSLGAGFVNFYDPNSGSSALQAFGELEVEATNGSFTFNGASGTSDTMVIGIADDSANDPGGIHDHLEFFLQDTNAPEGAYGLLLEAIATSPSNDVVTSDPFWFIFIHDQNGTGFEDDALGAFGVTAVPEPASGALLIGVAGAILVRRRKRLA